MSVLIELLDEFSRPVLKVILGLFGYDWDWEPTRASTKRRHPALSAFLCFAVSGIFLVSLIGLAWLALR